MAMTKGKLTVITGPMWSGKTTRLIEVAQKHKKKLYHVDVYRPNTDTRYSNRAIVTHDGEQIFAKTLFTDYPLFFLPKGKTIIVDEAHMFPMRMFTMAIRYMLIRGVDVYAAGIHIGYDGKALPTMHKLISMADSVETLSADCVECKKAVNYTKRRKDAPAGEIGGSERYINLCDACYLPKAN
jgi:thymidine kinase